MRNSTRITYLYDKYKSILKGKEFEVNRCAKQGTQAYYRKHKKKHTSILESETIYCGKEAQRQNQYYKAASFERNWKGVTLFVDGCIEKTIIENYKSDFNVAMLIESKYIHEFFCLIILNYLIQYFYLIIISIVILKFNYNT